MAGVNPALRQALLDKISELPGEGITVLFVEHDMDVVSAVAQRVVCMAEGSIIAAGTAGQVAANERVITAYLGGSSADLRDHERNTTTAPAPREDVEVHHETADPVTGRPEDGERDLRRHVDPDDDEGTEAT
jgi:ABC-type glutathione transport system ATPase component